MRTRRTTALADDEPEVGVSSEPQAESCHKEFSKAGRATSGHTSNAAAIGDKKAKKATKTMKRRDRDAEEVVELDRSSPAGSKQHTSRDAEQQGAKAKDPAGSRKLDRAVPQNQQRALDVGVRELKSAKLSHQTRATTEGKQDAMRDDDDDDDEAPEDDDAPEEVSMAAGKAGAAQQRQQEREAAAQRRAAARARAEKRAAVAAEQKADREAQRAARGEEAVSQLPVRTGDEPEEDGEDDLLPPDVLEAVIRQSREAEKSKQSEAAALGKNAQPEAKPGSREGRKRPKWDPAQPRKVGPVYVQILDQLPPPSASATAKAFAQQRMFGGGRKRSAEMLQPTAKQALGRGVPAAYRGSALKPQAV